MSDIITEFGEVINNQAKSIGRKFLPLIKSRVDMDDLINEAALVALEIHKKYDPERDPDKSRYMGIQIRYGLLRYVASNMYDLSAPYSAMYTADKENNEDFLHNNRAVRIVPPNRGVEDVPCSNKISADSIVFASGSQPHIDKLEKDEDIEILRQEIAKLNKDERTVIAERYLSESKRTKEDVAQQINVNQITVGIIEDRAKNKLRTRIKARHDKQ